RTPPVHRNIAGGGSLLLRFDVAPPDDLAPPFTWSSRNRLCRSFGNCGSAVSISCCFNPLVDDEIDTEIIGEEEQLVGAESPGSPPQDHAVDHLPEHLHPSSGPSS